MYDFIFYFIYRTQINQKDGGPFVAKYLATLIVMVTIGFQIVLIYSFIRFILFNYLNTDISIAWKQSNTIKFLKWIVIFIPFFLILFRYFKKAKMSSIIEKYKVVNIFSVWNIFKFFLLIFLPLITAIW